MVSPYSPKMHAGPVLSTHYYPHMYVLQQWTPLTPAVVKIIKEARIHRGIKIWTLTKLK